MSKLEKVGISEYINKFHTQHGRFKTECSDFVVHEMHQDGTCTDGPKLDVPAIVSAHSFIIDLSARTDFEVYDARFFQSISSEEDIVEMYNMLPACSVDGLSADADSERFKRFSRDALTDIENTYPSTQPKCTAPSHLSQGGESVCVGTYACQDRELRTAIHLALKPHPYIKTKTIGAAIHFIFSKVNTYVFTVKKTNRDTASVVSFLSKRIGHVSFAGNKDKKAVTYQRMSATTDFMKLYGCDVMNIKRGPAVKMGELSGNSFVVRVRDFQLKDVHELRFLNYFGNQRFGKGLNNHDVGKHMVENRFDEALELIIKTYSENYEKDQEVDKSEENAVSGGTAEAYCSAEEHTAECKYRSGGADTAYNLYLEGKYREAYHEIPPRFGVEKHIIACRMKNLDSRVIARSMRRESLMLYLHSYQSYLFNININKRLACNSGSSGNCSNRGSETDEYILKDGVFEAATSARLEDVWLKLERLPHPMCKGGFRKVVEVANDFQVEVEGKDTVFRFWLRPCAFATMAIREFIGDDILP